MPAPNRPTPQIVTIDTSRNRLVSQLSANGRSCFSVVGGLARHIVTIDRSRNGFVSRLRAASFKRFRAVGSGARQTATFDRSRNGFVSRLSTVCAPIVVVAGFDLEIVMIDASRNGFVSWVWALCAPFRVVTKLACQMVTIDRSRNGFVSQLRATAFTVFCMIIGLAWQIVAIDRSRNGFVSWAWALCARPGVVAELARRIVTIDRSRNGFVSQRRATGGAQFGDVAEDAGQIVTIDRSRNGFVSWPGAFFDTARLLESGDAIFRVNACHQIPVVGEDEFDRRQTHGFGRSRRGHANDLSRRPGDALVNLANGPIERALASMCNPRLKAGIRGRAARSSPGYIGRLRLSADRRTLGDRGGEPALMRFGRNFRRRHRSERGDRQAHRASVCHTHCSQPGAQAGRHSHERPDSFNERHGQNGTG